MGIACSSAGATVIHLEEQKAQDLSDDHQARRTSVSGARALVGSPLEDLEVRAALQRQRAAQLEEVEEDDEEEADRYWYEDEDDDAGEVDIKNLGSELSQQALGAETENNNETKKKKVTNPSTMAADVRRKMAKKFKSDDPLWNSIHILHGNPYVECRNNIKVVRIFTSSTFSDTKVERNTLMEQVFPRLKTFCRKKGYEFQVVDMRWGVRSEAEDDHRTEDLCMRELYACQELSTGPNFVTFLSHRYGYQPIPRLIEEKEFENIISTLDEEEKHFLKQWYRLDRNNVPPSYLLQPISYIYPDYVSASLEVYKAAKDVWWGTFERLRTSLLKGVDANIKDSNKKRIYHRAVTETEINAGILSAEKVDTGTFWFYRKFVDMEEQASQLQPGTPEEKTLQKFYDGVLNPEAKPLLEDLRNKKLPSKLPAGNIIEYPIRWNKDKGVNVDVPEHRQYIDKLCTDVTEQLEKMIVNGITRRQKEEVTDALYSEVVQHVNFCRTKSAVFNGRDKFLANIEEYMRNKQTDYPLILYGSSGSGKTSVMAISANMAWDWMGGKAAVIYRFIGTTSGSSSLQPLLHSIVGQLMRIYVGWNKQAPTDLKYLIEDFKDLLELCSEEKPLVLILDSLDQLDNLDGGRNLHWLPRKLPQYCKLIVSTLPEVEYGVFTKLQGLYKDQYVELTKMETGEVQDVLKLLLDVAGRKLTEEQQNSLIAAYNICPTPLFLKLNFDEALRWHSYDPIEMTRARLQVSVYETINALFERIEKSHGYIMVRSGLGCLTASRNGLSESEIEDILSLNDDVLNDVYQYHEPPMRRLPPLLWVRVRYDLENYLVNRGVDGVRVMYWYHRQFLETACVRYLADDNFREKCHSDLAEYFSGTWGDKPKPYTDKKGNGREALRYVSPQPLKFAAGGYNMRKIMQLPHHMIHAGDTDKLKQEVLCNYDFLLTKLKAASFGAVLTDLTAACLKYPEDQELSLIKETLQLSQDGLKVRAEEFGGQLAGRIHGTGSSTLIDEAKAMLEEGTLPPEALEILNMLESFEIQNQRKHPYLNEIMNQVRNPNNERTLLPHRGFLMPPGGQLMHKLTGHTDAVVDLVLTQDGTTAITGSFDRTVKVWHVRSGEMRQSLDLAQPVSFLCLCNEDKWLVVSCSNKEVYVIDVATTTIMMQLQGPKDSSDIDELGMPVTVCKHGDSEILVLMRNKFLDFWSFSTGELETSVENQLEDWSVDQCGLYIEHRHIGNHGQYFIHAGYRAAEFFIGDSALISDPEQILDCIGVFDSYEYDGQCKDPDFTPKEYDHIGAITIHPSNSQVILCNGANNHLLFYSLPDGEKLRIIQFNGNAKVRAMFFPPEGNQLFFCNRKNVATLNVANNEAHTLLKHPCKVYRVVGIPTSRYVLTIAEDSILRIWDKRMPDFSADISMFTGKVKVSSKAAMDKASTEFKQMYKQITGNDAKTSDAKELLTTDEMENYWTKEVRRDEFEEVVTSQVETRFHHFINPNYLGVTHSHLKQGYAFCFSIWDLTHVSCSRRIFLPDTLYAFCVVNDECLVIGENNRLKLLNLSTFRVKKRLPGRISMKYRPTVIYNHLRGELVSENEDGKSLQVYDFKTHKPRGTLYIPSSLEAARRKKKSSTSLLSSFTLSKNGRLATLVYGKTPHIIVWSMETLSHLYTIDPTHRDFGLSPLKDARYNWALARDGRHLVLTRDLTKNIRDQKDATKSTSCVLIDMETGKSVGHASPYNEGTSKLVTVMDPVPLIRSFKRKSLQIVGIGADHKAHYISEALVGRYNSQVLMSDNCDRLVTWGQHPRDKTIRYWAYCNNMLTLLGSFTPDKEVGDVALVDNGRTLVIDSSGGLVKLQLHGKDVAAPDDSQRRNADRLFPGVELDKPYIAVQPQDEKGDSSDTSDSESDGN